MRIVFNGVAFIEFAICVLIVIILEVILNVLGASEGIRSIAYKIVGTLAFLCVVIIGDLFIRYASVTSSNEKKYKMLFPNRGGHIFFIPTFIFGIFMIFIVMTGV